jgi:antitoxin (DNA-binding transcriptional repressor) of toxin-antitoxin stability system
MSSLVIKSVSISTSASTVFVSHASMKIPNERGPLCQQSISYSIDPSDLLWSNSAIDWRRAMIANISEVKAHFSRMVDRAYHGETVVIAKNGTPLVDLVRHQPSRTRKLGLLAGRIKISDDAFETNAEIEEMFYGNGQ